MASDLLHVPYKLTGMDKSKLIALFTAKEIEEVVMNLASDRALDHIVFLHCFTKLFDPLYSRISLKELRNFLNHALCHKLGSTLLSL